MSEINLFNRWTVKKKHFWLAVGLGIPALCVVLFFVFALLGFPIAGGSEMAYDTADFGYSAGEEGMGAPMTDMDYAAEAEAMEESVRSSMAKDLPVENMTASTDGSAVIERLLIREGNITVAVNNTIETREKIQDIVDELSGQGAYIVTASESGRGENRQPYIQMTIRVPVKQFDSVMDQIAEMAVRVDERYQTSQDVTEEYVDLEGRIEAMEISIERLKDFMRGATLTEDLLSAETQLAQREAEMEALQGRLNYLAQSAALSLINVYLSPYELSEPIDTSWKPAETFRASLENLLESMKGFADFLIQFGVSVLPWLIFFGLIIWGVVAVIRRRRKKKSSAGDQSE
jgi:hypothetical protein